MANKLLKETAAKRKIPPHRYIRRGKTVTLEFDCNGKVDSYTFEIKKGTVEECDARRRLTLTKLKKAQVLTFENAN